MAIRAIVEGREIKQERVIELAKGMRDEYGNEFELIELTPTKPTRKIDGFQDTYIYIMGGDTTPTIKYGPRARGNIEFIANELGIAIGKVAKTPENMKMLAATYHDNVWKPLDKRIEKEIKELASTFEMDQYAKERRKNLNAKPGDNVSTSKQLDKNIELTKKMEEVKKAETPVAPKVDIAAARATREKELELMDMGRLRKMAESTGLLEPGFKEKTDLIGAVLRYEHNKQKGPQEELSIE